MNRNFRRDNKALRVYDVSRYNGASIVAYDMLRQASVTSGPNLTALYTASGLRVPREDVPHDYAAPLSTIGMVYLAEKFGATLSDNQGVAADVKVALSAGQIMAPWTNCTLTTEADRDAALLTVYQCLNQAVPTENEITNVYNSIFVACEPYSHVNTIVSKDVVLDSFQVVGDESFGLNIRDDGVNTQKYHFLLMLGNAIPNDLMQEDDHKNLWASLQDRNDLNPVEIPHDVHPAIIPEAERRNIWVGWSNEARMAFYEVLARNSKTHVVTTGVTYAVLAILSFAKSGNTTEGYLERRIKALAPALPGARLEGRINTQIVTAFSQSFSSGHITADQAYSAISAYYYMFDDLKTDTLKWVIEQSAANNITTAMTVAEMLLKYPDAPYEKIFSKIGFDQVTKWAELVCHLAYDRFCSFITPPVTMAQYPDLAYLGAYVMFVAQNSQPGVNVAYKGTPDQRARLPKSTLMTFGDAIVDTALTDARNALSLQEEIKHYYPDYDVRRLGTNYYMVPKVLPADEEGMSAQEKKNLLRAERMHWDRQMMNAPNGTVYLTAGDVLEKIRTDGVDNSVRTLAYRLNILATSLQDSGRQELIPLIEDVRVNVTQRKKMVPEIVRNVAATFGVVIDPQWSRRPDDIDPVAPFQNDRVNAYTRTWRSDVPGLVAAAQEAPAAVIALPAPQGFENVAAEN